MDVTPSTFITRGVVAKPAGGLEAKVEKLLGVEEAAVTEAEVGVPASVHEKELRRRERLYDELFLGC